MFCRETRYATANEQRLAAEKVVQQMTHQREQMSAQLFGLTQDNAALKEEVRVLQERLAGEQADKEAQVSNLSHQSPVLLMLLHLSTRHVTLLTHLEVEHSLLHVVTMALSGLCIMHMLTMPTVGTSASQGRAATIAHICHILSDNHILFSQ